MQRHNDTEISLSSQGQLTLNDLAKREGEEKFWARNADMYHKMAQLESSYTKRQVEAMRLRSTDRVLDLGCGVGRLSIPMANVVKEVIGLDISGDMLRHAKKFAERTSCQNVRFIKMDFMQPNELSKWEDIDVIVCSRIPFLPILSEISRIAKRKVIALGFANAPNLMQIRNEMFYKIAGNPTDYYQENRQEGYRLYFDAVYEAGYDACIELVADGFCAHYDSKEACLADMSSLGIVNVTDMRQLEKNLAPFCHTTPSGYQFERLTESYLLYWYPHKKDPTQ